MKLDELKQNELTEGPILNAIGNLAKMGFKSIGNILKWTTKAVPRNFKDPINQRLIQWRQNRNSQTRANQLYGDYVRWQIKQQDGRNGINFNNALMFLNKIGINEPIIKDAVQRFYNTPYIQQVRNNLKEDIQIDPKLQQAIQKDKKALHAFFMAFGQAFAAADPTSLPINWGPLDPKTAKPKRRANQQTSNNYANDENDAAEQRQTSQFSDLNEKIQPPKNYINYIQSKEGIVWQEFIHELSNTITFSKVSEEDKKVLAMLGFSLMKGKWDANLLYS